MISRRICVLLVPAIRDGLLCGFGAVNEREDDALGAKVEDFLDPHVGKLRHTNNHWGVGRSESVDALQAFGDASKAVLKVKDDEVVASPSCYLHHRWGEAEERHAVQAITVLEASFDGFRCCGGDDLVGFISDMVVVVAIGVAVDVVVDFHWVGEDN